MCKIRCTKTEKHSMKMRNFVVYQIAWHLNILRRWMHIKGKRVWCCSFLWLTTSQASKHHDFCSFQWNVLIVHWDQASFHWLPQTIDMMSLSFGWKWLTFTLLTKFKKTIMSRMCRSDCISHRDSLRYVLFVVVVAGGGYCFKTAISFYLLKKNLVSIWNCQMW